MDLQISGRRAVVTGSTAGIGFATAQRLLQEGAHVTICGHHAERLRTAEEVLVAQGGASKVSAVLADLATAEGCAALAEANAQADILVNNLGIYEPGEFDDTEDAVWQRFFDVNVMSGVRLSRQALSAMKGRGFGRIVFISSESALNPPTEMLHYGMTKTAQLSISRGLAELTTGTGVTVNAVLPGPTRTDGSVAFLNRLANEQQITVQEVERRYFADDRPSSLLRRFIEPAEVAATVAFLCSPFAAATNGAAVRVDGGVVRSIA